MSDKSNPSGDAENSRKEKPSRGGIFGRRGVCADGVALASQTAAAAQNGPVEPQRVPLLRADRRVHRSGRVRRRDRRGTQGRPAGRRQGRADRARGRRRTHRRPAGARGRHRKRAAVLRDDIGRRQPRRAEARRIFVQGRRQHARGRAGTALGQGSAALPHASRGAHQRPDRPTLAGQRHTRRRSEGAAARGIAVAGNLQVRARRDASGASDHNGERRRPRRSTRSGRSARPICRSNRPANS